MSKAAARRATGFTDGELRRAIAAGLIRTVGAGERPGAADVAALSAVVDAKKRLADARFAAALAGMNLAELVNDVEIR